MRFGAGFRERAVRDGLLRAVAGSLGWRTQRLVMPVYTTLLSPHQWPVAIVREQVDPLLDLLKLENLLRFLEETNPISGDVVECGVYKGGTLVAMAVWLRRLKSSRVVHGFDSFAGLPQLSAVDRAGGKDARRGALGDTTAQIVMEKARRLSVEDRIVLHEGFFEDTLPTFQTPRLSFIHLDCDLYESYKTALHYLWPKLSSGGVIVFDEFAEAGWPGARMAIDEFFRDKIETPKGLSFGQGYVRKTEVS